MWSLRMVIKIIGNYLRCWGHTLQRIAKRRYARNIKAIEKQLEEKYFDIQTNAQKEKIEIYQDDETVVRNDCMHSRGSVPKGGCRWLTYSPRGFKPYYLGNNNLGVLQIMVSKQTIQPGSVYNCSIDLTKTLARGLTWP